MKRMKVMKQGIAAAMIAAMAFSMTACSSSAGTDSNSVTVQSVSMLMGLDLTGVNRYIGVAEAKSTINITKDSSKTVAEVKVEEGQEVKKGDVLFTYDQDSLKLSVETAELEIEQMENQIETYDSEIKDLEEQKKNTSDASEKLEITLQIQDTQLDKAKDEYDLKVKKKDYESMQKTVGNAEVTAPADGVIQSIKDDSDSGSYDYSDDSSTDSNEEVYMTIMETGTYKVKATVSETNLASLYIDEPVTVVSRTDSTQMWSGSITKIDTENTQSTDNSSSDYYDSDSSGESASKYTFYVEVENSDGMLMGQHLYILPEIDLASDNTVELPSAYIVQESENAYVWAATGSDKLEYRQITLGEYNSEADTYEITDGLTLDDFIAMPENGLKAGSDVVKVDGESYASSEDETEYGDEIDGEYDEEYGDEIDGEYDEEYGDEIDGEYDEEYSDELDGEYDEEYYDETDGDYSDEDFEGEAAGEIISEDDGEISEEE